MAELTIFGFFGLLRAATQGYSFVPSSRIQERVRNTLAGNYPEANLAFLRFANGYWTYKLLVGDVFEQAPDLVLNAFLSEHEQNTGALFFPTPGPVMGPSPAERESKQRELLSEWVPELDVDDGSVPSVVEKRNGVTSLLTKENAHRGEGGLRREEGYHD